MAKVLLSCKFKSILHIALIFALAFCVEKASAQSVLLPGDIVIVTANSSNDSFGFIPLIDVEENTVLYFSNIVGYDGKEYKAENPLRVVFKSSVTAGTAVNIGLVEDDRFDVTGDLSFAERSRLLAYQQEEGIIRFVFGVEWGKKPEDHEDQKLPETINEYSHTFVNLGEAPNAQYFIRNGASGTAKMLQNFVAAPENWRMSERPFPALGTSFTLLSPPVVLFENSYSSVEENAKEALIKVAIYEHDGSRLTVDVAFDSLRSIAGKDDFDGFSHSTINFTGLIGDGVYDVQVPVTNDDLFEGNETGIFTLENLSSGNYGDFINHNVVILDDETPDVQILHVYNSASNDSYIELLNNEKGVVSLNGWSILSNKNEYKFTDDISILPGERIRVVDEKRSAEFSGKTIEAPLYVNLLRRRGGELLLSSLGGEIISRRKYSAAVRNNNQEKDSIALPDPEETINAERLHTVATFLNENSAKPGWKSLPGSNEVFQLFSETDLYFWNENQQKFSVANSEDDRDRVLFGFFEEDLLSKFINWKNTRDREKISIDSGMKFSLSATDVNKNEYIDELEGLNLVQNSLNAEVSVSILLKEFEKINPSLSLSSHIYVTEYLENGMAKLQPKSGTDKLQPGTPFWLMVGEPSEDILIDISESSILNHSEETEEALSEFPRLILTVSDGVFTDEIELNFSLPDVETSGQNIKDISAYPAFNLPSIQPLNISIQQGIEYYSLLDFPEKPEQNFLLPLVISSADKTVKLEVSEWKNIPLGWEIMLYDATEGKEFNLRKGFTLTAETSPKKDLNEEETIEAENVNNEPRYFLKVYSSPQEKLDEENTIPKELELFQNYPNPFNPFTTISFYLPEPGEVKLSVFNIVGQPVAVLVEGSLSAGQQQFEWDATDRPSGMYIYQLETGNKVLTRKMTLVK